MENSTILSSPLVSLVVSNLSHSSPTPATRMNSMMDNPLELASDEQLRLTRLVVQKCLVPIITCAGVTGNVVSIAVLTHKSMKTSTNCYLTALAIFDILYLVTSLALSLKHYEDINEQKIYKYFYLYSRVLADIWSNVSVCLTVTFTLERYVGVCHPIKGRAVCTPKRARIITCCVVLFVLIATSPEFLEREVFESKNNKTLTITEIITTEIGESRAYTVFYHWFIVAMFTFIPLAALLGFNIILIRSVCKANRIRRRMTYVAVNRPGEAHSGEHTRITCMLISVAFVFIICQLPTATMICYITYLELSGTELTHTENNYRKIAGNVANILISLNAAVNFFLYSVMSTKFRKVFQRLFCKHSRYTLGKSISEYSYSTGMSTVRRISSCRGAENRRIGLNSHSPEHLIRRFRPPATPHRSQESLTSRESFKRNSCYTKRSYTDTVL